MSEPTDPQPLSAHPDYRYSLANERTFLAWVRTALALLAAGIGVVALPSHFSSRAGRDVLSVVLIVLAVLAAGNAYLRWRTNEAAITSGTPLPPSRTMPIVAVGLTAVAVIALALVLADL